MQVLQFILYSVLPAAFEVINPYVSRCLSLFCMPRCWIACL